MDSLIVEPSARRILVIDDDPAMRDLLHRRLTRLGYVVVRAGSGRLGLELLDAADFHLVLLDVAMPVMDGFEVLRRIRRRHDALDLPVIMVTGLQDAGSVVRALQAGASDYVVKPIDFPVAEARVRTHLNLRAARDRLLEHHRRQLRDLDAAAKMQRALLPGRSSQGGPLRYGWHYQPCDTLGGDLLNVFWITDRYLGFYVLDVSGHGIPSALLSIAVSRSLSPHLRQGSVIVDLNPHAPTPAVVPPAEVARRLNAGYRMDEHGGLFFTLQYGVIDLVRRSMQFVSAGHPNPIRIGGDGVPSELPCTGGPPIGVAEDVEYVEASVELAPGDKVILFSDGMYEQRNARGEPFGLPRLRELAARVCDDTELAAERLVGAVRRWSAPSVFRDDVSVLALELS